jgi:hypothetical protein
LLAGAAVPQVAAAYYVGGDPIGPNSSATDNTGGFTAVKQNGVNLGQPAMLVSLNGRDVLTEFRAVVFGVPAASGSLSFDKFDYRLDVWRSADYFAGLNPQTELALGTPVGLQLVPSGPTRMVPNTPFGTAGTGGGNATTYDFHFDLTKFPVFAAPLAAGDWVFGFQSWHDPTSSGSLRVTGSGAGQGPLPLFSRDNGIPRGILGGQDPNNIAVHWGMSLAAVPAISLSHGDYNGDGVVNAADYTVWRDGLKVDPGYALWKTNFGVIISAAQNASVAVPEPASLPMFIGGSLVLVLLRPRQKSAVFSHRLTV